MKRTLQTHRAFWLISLMLLTLSGKPVQSQTIASAKNLPQPDAFQDYPKGLSVVLSELAQRFNIVFNYDTETVDNKKVSAKSLRAIAKQDDLENTLEDLLRPLGLNFEKFEDASYAIYPQPKKKEIKRIRTRSATYSPGPHEEKYVLSLSTLRAGNKAITAHHLRMPEQTVSGTVTDSETGEALPGVNVLAKGTSTGTVTDVEGNYRLTVADGVTTLVFSSIGYVSQEVEINERTTINLALLPNIQSLQEVVVVGYGTQAKKDITSSIASVSGEQLAKVPVARLDQALQGQIPGVVVTSNDGTPGGDVSIRVRGYGTAAAGGDNAPLYVIDGVPTKQGINLLNPNDIESIDVLKDAAAASVYGVQASNGVVVITTKRGEAGKARFTFDTYQGISSAWRKDIPVMNPRQLAEFNNLLFAELNEGLTPDDDGYMAPNPAYADPSSIPTEGTDWQDAIFRNARLQDYNLGFTGGSEGTRFALSVGYRNQEGIIINSDMKRYTFRGNIDHEATDYLKVGANFSYSQVERTGVNTNIGFDAITSLALTYPGLFPVREPDGTYGLLPQVNNNYWGDAKNPVALAERADRIDVDNGITGSVYAEAELIKNLSVRSLFGFGRWFGDNRSFNLPVLWTDSDYNLPGGLNQSSYENTNWNWDNTLTYTKAFNNQSINIVVGTSAQSFGTEFIYTSQNGFLAKDPQYRYFGFGDPGTFVAGSSQADRSLLSYFGRINYEFKDKYLAQVVVRRDGSSVFSEDNRWGTFPAASLGWRVSEEGFMQSIPYLDDMKLRASWGLSGNQFIGDYYPTYSRLTTGVNYVVGGQVLGGVRPSQLGNPNVSWENSQQFDIGMDASLFNSRVSLTLDYYKKTTTDMLLKVTLPAIGGAAAPPAQNVGSLVNEGVEFALSYQSKPETDFVYSISLNGATLRNEITSLGDLEFVLPTNRIGYGIDDEVTRALVGSTVSSYYGYVFDGIYQNQEQIDSGPTPDRTSVQPGDVRWKDISGPDGVPDGAITDDDRTTLGDAIPDFSYGLNLTANYKNLDFSAFFQGVSGVEIFSVTYRASVDEAGGRNGLLDALNYWSGEGTTNQFPRATINDAAGNARVSDRYVFDGDYLRLRNLQIGYSLPSRWLESIRMTRFRIYLGAQNLVTLTKYFNFDPEVGQNTNQGGSNQDLQLGIDQGVYPQPRTFIIGANITF